MVNSEAKENEIKSIVHVTKDITLLFIAFTVFTFIATINAKILQDDFLLTLQLVISIPLFMSAVLSRSKLGISKKAKVLDQYGNITFLIAYACLINVVGILLNSIINNGTSEIFFIVNVLTVISYSIIKIKHDSKEIYSQISQDLIFILFIVVFGLLHVLNFY